MKKTFNELFDLVKGIKKKKIAVAIAQDKHALEAIKETIQCQLADAILVGDRKKIEEVAEKIEFDLSNVEVIDEPDTNKAVLLSVNLVSSGEADMLMKGSVETAIFLRGVLNKELGLRSEKIISHVAVIDVPIIDRLLFLTDAAFNPYPDLKVKKDMICNAVQLARACGVREPKVAIIGAVEVVNPDMPATLDAAILSKMNDRRQIDNCIIDGPFALDNAISEESANHKGINSQVAGKADILLMPNIEAANVMYKTITYMCKAETGGILVGAKAPIILTSRSDNFNTKINSIILAILLANNK